MTMPLEITIRPATTRDIPGVVGIIRNAFQLVAVLPTRQRLGYGRALVDLALDEARFSGARQVEIGIIAKQVELRDWYGKIGFREQRTANFPHLPFEVLFMSKTLDPNPLRHSGSPESGPLTG